MNIAFRILVLLVVCIAPFQAAEKLALNMRQAVEIALAPDGNTRVRLVNEAVKQARSRAAQARSALLPNVEGSIQYDDRTLNLAASGIQFESMDMPISVPSKVGPFTVFDARASGSQTLFSYSAIRRYQAARQGVRGAESQDEATQETVASQTARAYLAALRAEARLDASHANVALAETLFKLAQSQKDAGTGTGIDVTRAQVQLANERQLLLVVENERRQALLTLLRAMDLRLDTEIELTDRLELHPVDTSAAEESLQNALASRPDWETQQRSEEAARLEYSATKWERLPSVAAFGNYGAIGEKPSDSFSTRTYGVRLTLPIFDGGRVDARRSESASRLREERIRTADLRDAIELDIRLALDALRSASEQVDVAEAGLDLAEQELEQAQRRFRAGVASSIEVTDAQSRLARARDNRIAALFQHENARLDYGQAVGNVRQLINQ